jgi:hypothetical protein
MIWQRHAQTRRDGPNGLIDVPEIIHTLQAFVAKRFLYHIAFPPASILWNIRTGIFSRQSYPPRQRFVHSNRPSGNDRNTYFGKYVCAPCFDPSRRRHSPGFRRGLRREHFHAGRRPFSPPPIRNPQSQICNRPGPVPSPAHGSTPIRAAGRMGFSPCGQHPGLSFPRKRESRPSGNHGGHGAHGE